MNSQRRKRRLQRTILAALLCLCTPTVPASAQPSARARVAALEIEPLVAQGDCGEALPRLRTARAQHPDDAVLAQLEGTCLLRTFDYAGAEQALADAKRLDPTLPNLEVQRAIALYHLEDFTAAATAIEAARDNHTPDYAAQLHLYAGLIALGRGEARKAALELERARAADPTQVEPVASFYAGLAWQSVNAREEARESFERVIEVNGDGSWGRQARELLESEQLRDRTWAQLTVGVDYDSNVILLGEALPVPQGISGESDGRAVWLVEAGSELFRTDRWSGGVSLEYAGSAHFELHDFDVEYPGVSGWIDRSVGERSLARIRYSIGNAWVGYESYLLSQRAVLSFFHNWGRPGSTELALTWDWNDYHYPILPIFSADDPSGSVCTPVRPFLPCSPFGIEAYTAQNRDGNGLRVGFEHRYPVRGLHTDWLRGLVLRGGYTYGVYFAQGDDWDFQAHALLAAFEVGLPWSVELDFETLYTYAPFAHVSSFPTPPAVQSGTTYTVWPYTRTDEIVDLTTILARPINDWLEVSARYYYTRNVSNVPVFDYDRNVVGAYLTVDF